MRKPTSTSPETDPMTAPDSVERVVAEMRIPHEGGWDNDDVDALADRLQALARGPQQAGGEDAKDAARYRFLRDRCNHKGPPTAILFSSDLEPDAAIDAAIGGTGDA